MAAVALAALATVAFVAVDRMRQSPDPRGGPPTIGTAGPTAPSTTASGPACRPKITETGFSVTDHEVHYGVIARSDCPHATYNNALSVRVLDAAGNRIDGQNEDQPELNVLLPGQEVGGGGTFYMNAITTVSKVEVTFTAGSPAPVEAFAAWPTSVRVADLSVGKPDAAGRTIVTGRIVTQPPNASLCSPHTGLILRDASGKIIYGEPGYPRGKSVYFDITMPARADPSKATVYVALGQTALSLDPVSTAACRR